MNYRRLENGVFIDVDESQLVDGDRIQKEVLSGVWAEMNYSAPQTEPDVYAISGLSVTPSDVALSGDYSVDIDTDITISATLVDGSAIDYTGYVIKIPIVRHADGKPTDDEIYFDTTITNGVFSATGKLPRSGDWKLLASRVNKALKRINASWKIDADDVGMLS